MKSLTKVFLSFVVGLVGSETSCLGIRGLDTTEQVHACVDELLRSGTGNVHASAAGGVDVRLTPAQENVLRKADGSLREIRVSCRSSVDQSTSWGCMVISDLAYQVFAEGMAVFYFCMLEEELLTQSERQQEVSTIPSGTQLKRFGGASCDARGHEGALAVINLWMSTEVNHRTSPAKLLVSDTLEALRADVVTTLNMEDRLPRGTGDTLEKALPPVWSCAARAVEDLRQATSAKIWRETQWLWLMDSLHAGRVVQTTWGSCEQWKENFGVNDCAAEAPLSSNKPRYIFDERHGMRWEILKALLRELNTKRSEEKHKRQQVSEEMALLTIVEVGVFSGRLSDELLKGLDFIRLLGVDPYIGNDGTFPGNFSDTLDPDAAYYRAASIMEPFAAQGRADLWPMTSAEAASRVPDGSVDAVFIDGCHLYECVRDDLDLWLPKLRRGATTLLVGHDFSPQWPGVVRAVHERRGNQEVRLASDWMFWWFEDNAY